ncbi:A/G-specific adenine glycosylase [Lichenihabitans sp. Uapishka_5]|uniref:A/G-specific adenine glycosylase n=1 Tax=Lichenihabitans sp. Uapishka_5 TaxID=3037302 RepID=UPI003FA52669
MSKSAPIPSSPNPDAATVAPLLLAWYDRHRRTLPWRSPPGVASDPYAVWLSEIMLQQTTVAAVKPYYTSFLARWPTVEALAAAPLTDVLQAWAGLGYYSRARNLHACAAAVVARHGGAFPGNEAGLRTLPGIGAYTAAAIAAIAFERRAVVVDGNVERVMARLCAVLAPLPGAKPILYAAMDRVTPDARTGDFAQAMMDLGATICTPRKPACVICPLATPCRARAEGLQADLPRKTKKAAVPERGGAVFVIERSDGAVLVRHRPPSGLFGGLPEFPSTPWVEGFAAGQSATLPDDLTTLAGPTRHLGQIEHGLTHFKLTLDVHHVSTPDSDADGKWVAPSQLDGIGFPTLMRKVLKLYQDMALAGRR